MEFGMLLLLVPLQVEWNSNMARVVMAITHLCKVKLILLHLSVPVMVSIKLFAKPIL